MAEYASAAVGNAGLATGIIGTALGAINSGMFNGGLFGNWNGNAQNNYVNRETFDLSLSLAASQRDNAILSAELNTEKKMVEVFNAANDKIMSVRDELGARITELNAKVDSGFATQAVLNTQSASAINLLQNQVTQLYTMTQLVIPATNVCPEPMPAKNTWVAPTGA